MRPIETLNWWRLAVTKDAEISEMPNHQKYRMNRESDLIREMIAASNVRENSASQIEAPQAEEKRNKRTGGWLSVCDVYS